MFFFISSWSIQGKCDKYTSYSSETGITKTNQSTLHILTNTNKQQNLNQTQPRSIPELMLAIRYFAIEREWSQFHTPRNLTLAMLGEAGELGELFQYLGDYHSESECGEFEYQMDAGVGSGLKGSGWSDELVDKVQQEVADVAIYCLRLADVVGIHCSEMDY